MRDSLVPVVALASAIFAPVASAKDEAPTYVGEAVCMSCHGALDEQLGDRYAETIHAKALTAENATTELMRKGCEACHGPGSAHVAAGGGRGIEGFEGFSGDATAAQNQKCLTCHRGGAQRYWQGSAHHTRDLGCISCHTLMRRVSDSALLNHKTQIGTCASCHLIQNARVYRNSHMPLRPGRFQSSTADDGKMSCGSCHNPHGAIADHLISAVSTNDSCLSCHAGKRGPFLWEHAPVTENCLNCHDPHGTTRANMLKLGVPRLCQSCHNSRAHPSSPRGSTDRMVIGSGCLQCHPNIHGSNHPSGFVFSR